MTGAASGMGRATAHLFADEGAKVLVTDVDRDGLDLVAGEIANAYGSETVRALSGDIAEVALQRSLVEIAVATWGGVDILVNNAGISRLSSVYSDDATFESHWDRTLAVNVTAHARLIRACLPWLLQAPCGGRVVNVASTEAIVATGGLAAYTASKHAVIGLTKSFAVELGRTGVTVNAICPGPIRTAMTASIPDEAKEKYARRRVPVRRYGDPEEVAHMTLNLCLPSASFVNGATVVVDGGMTVNH